MKASKEDILSRLSAIFDEGELRKLKQLKLVIYLKKEVVNNGKCSTACNTH